MTPLESEFLHRLGSNYLASLEHLWIVVFFYGASSCSRYEAYPRVRYQECLLYSFRHRSLTTCSFYPSAKSLISQGAPKLDRRRGFSSRRHVVVFATTVINFIFSSLNAGAKVAGFVVFIRQALILDIDYPLSEMPELVDNGLQTMNIITVWVANLPVSIKLSISDPSSIHPRWRYCSAIFLSFGTSSRTVRG